MTLKLGELEVDIGADTSGLKKAESEVKGSSLRIKNEFDEIGKKSNVVTGRFKNVGRSAGQLGIQLSQLTGQIQGGQNAMLALSQQSADIGFLLGPTGALVGAVVSIAAAIGGPFLMSLIGAKDNTEELEEALESLSKVSAETADGIDVLSKEITALAKESESAARNAIRGGIIAGMEAMTAATSLASDEIKDLAGQMEFSGRAQRGAENRFNRLAKELGITKKEFKEIRKSVIDFNKDASVDNLQSLQETVDRIADTNENASNKLIEFSNTLRSYTTCLLYTSPSRRDRQKSRMPSSA